MNPHYRQRTSEVSADTQALDLPRMGHREWSGGRGWEGKLSLVYLLTPDVFAWVVDRQRRAEAAIRAGKLPENAIRRMSRYLEEAQQAEQAEQAEQADKHVIEQAGKQASKQKPSSQAVITAFQRVLASNAEMIAWLGEYIHGRYPEARGDCAIMEGEFSSSSSSSSRKVLPLAKPDVSEQWVNMVDGLWPRKGAAA